MFNKVLQYYENKKVLITGHTGFKGSWLSIWLHLLNADITGYALEPKTSKDNFILSGIGKKIKDHIGSLDQQQLISKAIGKDEYASILRNSAHRIKTWIWTKSRNEPYIYEAFLTSAEGKAFDTTSDDIVLRYEEIARRNLAAKEGFSTGGFGDSASKMLRIRKTGSSVLDRDGNQVWPEDIPKWRLNSTPGLH